MYLSALYPWSQEINMLWPDKKREVERQSEKTDKAREVASDQFLKTIQALENALKERQPNGA